LGRELPLHSWRLHEDFVRQFKDAEHTLDTAYREREH
jgi:hypothetical protein